MKDFAVISVAVCTQLIQKRFYNRETIPCISTMSWNTSTLSWLAEILTLWKVLIIWVAWKLRGIWYTSAIFHNSARQLIVYHDSSFVNASLKLYFTLLHIIYVHKYVRLLLHNQNTCRKCKDSLGIVRNRAIKYELK